MFSCSALQEQLSDAGLNTSDTVLIHSSMKKIGGVEGGAEGVLRALTGYFASGLVVFPTLSYSVVNAEHPRFSVNETPCVTGILPELFRKMPGVVRSLHPTHSVAAFGRDAAEFVGGHENFDSPCHRDSPWGKLYDRNAKILFIGTGLACNTFLHGVEEWLPVPGMLTEEAQSLVSTDSVGGEHPVSSRRHLGGHSAYYAEMEPLFRRVGALSEFHFGDAPTCVLDCRKAGDAVFAELRKNPLMFTDEFHRQK